MSVEAFPEQEQIIERLKLTVPSFAAVAPSAEARVYDFVPEERDLQRDEANIFPLVYGIVTFGALFPRSTDRTIEGVEQQPQIMPVIIECWASTSALARKAGGEVRSSLLGWAPEGDNASAIELRGGGWFDRRDAAGRPSRWMQQVTAELDLNMSFDVP